MPSPDSRCRRRLVVLIRAVLGVVAGGLLLAVAYDLAGRERVWAALQEGPLNAELLVAAAAGEVLALLVRSVRWRLILRSIRPVRLVNTFSATAVGMAAENLLPLRVDDLVRAYVLGRREGLPTSVTLGTVAVLRAGDLLVLAAILAAAVVFLPVPADLSTAVPYVAAALAVGLGALAAAALGGDRLAERLGRAAPDASAARRRFLAALSRAVAGFARAVRAFPRRWRLPAVLGLVAAEVAIVLGEAHLVSAALEVHIPASALLVVVLGGYASFTIPSSPGAVGLYHTINVTALRLYGVPQEQAGAFVLVLHLILLVPSSLIGVVCLWRERAGVGRLVEVCAPPAQPPATSHQPPGE